MTSTVVFIVHKTRPGQRDSVKAVWMKHMATAIEANGDHLRYYYCFDNGDEDAICAFQEYRSPQAAQAFLSHASYRAYLAEVEPLLAGPPAIRSLAPQWTK
jgi:quinol monooxygenase YgiN